MVDQFLRAALLLDPENRRQPGHSLGRSPGWDHSGRPREPHRHPATRGPWGSYARPESGPPLLRAIEPQTLREFEITYLQLLHLQVAGSRTAAARLGEGPGLFGAANALYEQLHRGFPWMPVGTSARLRPRRASHLASRSESSHEPSQRTGSILGKGQNMEAQPLGSYQEVPTSCCPVPTEIDHHDPKTGNFERVLGVYSRFGWCFRLRSRIGVHFTSRPDISIAGNYRTFLLRFDSGQSQRHGGALSHHGSTRRVIAWAPRVGRETCHLGQLNLIKRIPVGRACVVRRSPISETL